MRTQFSATPFPNTKPWGYIFGSTFQGPRGTSFIFGEKTRKINIFKYFKELKETSVTLLCDFDYDGREGFSVFPPIVKQKKHIWREHDIRGGPIFGGGRI